MWYAADHKVKQNTLDLRLFPLACLSPQAKISSQQKLGCFTKYQLKRVLHNLLEKSNQRRGALVFNFISAWYTFCISIKAPFMHSFLGWQSIQHGQPSNECMLVWLLNTISISTNQPHLYFSLITSKVSAQE